MVIPQSHCRLHLYPVSQLIQAVQVPWMAGDESGHFALGAKKPKFSEAITTAAAEFTRVKQANVSTFSLFTHCN